VTGLGWGVRSLGRQPLRTALSLAGIAVAAAMLLDMVMLSGGIDKSFSEMLLVRGYQIRLTPKGTLPFDTEASLPGATRLVRDIRAEPGRASGRSSFRSTDACARRRWPPSPPPARCWARPSTGGLGTRW
jgi:hypothetical protein